MSFLTEIMVQKKRRVAEATVAVPIESLRERTTGRQGAHLFRAALSDPERFNVIAEFKRRSPSKGVIRADANVKHMVQLYEEGGAAAISVLTEADYFSGSLDDLVAVKASVSLPVLRKDFVFSEYQVLESVANGADAILLIVAALDDDALLGLRHLAEAELGIDALVEVHTADEMRRAVNCGSTLIGVNNRDLNTFNVSLETSISLAGEAPSNSLLVSESGLHTVNDLKRLHASGYSAFLLGESLMRSDSPATALRKLTEAGLQ